MLIRVRPSFFSQWSLDGDDCVWNNLFLDFLCTPRLSSRPDAMEGFEDGNEEVGEAGEPAYLAWKKKSEGAGDQANHGHAAGFGDIGAGQDSFERSQAELVALMISVDGEACEEEIHRCEAETVDDHQLCALRVIEQLSSGRTEERVDVEREEKFQRIDIEEDEEEQDSVQGNGDEIFEAKRAKNWKWEYQILIRTAKQMPNGMKPCRDWWSSM